MKKILLYTLAGLLLAAFPVSESRSQGVTTLFVDSMPGFPSLPGDTVYEGQSYTFSVIVVNNTNQLVTGSVSIQMRVDSIISTIVNNPQATIPPGDTLSFSVTGYNFTQPQFKMGNNIVVVWPAVNGLSVPVDSLYDNVFFVPLNSLGTIAPEAAGFEVFPIPASRSLYIRSAVEWEIEYVRIYAVDGRRVLDLPGCPDGRVDISSLVPGHWIIEIGNASHRVFRKFISE